MLYARLVATLARSPDWTLIFTDGTVHVAIGLGKRLLAVHHPCAGFFAQFSYHGC